MPSLADALAAFSFLVTMYFVLWNVTQLAISPLAALTLWRHRQRQTRRARQLVNGVFRLPLISIIVPARNEELTIVENVRALLAVEYRPCELVIVNDDSTDGTLAVLQRTFELVPAPVASEPVLVAAPVRGIFRSVTDSNLIVIDKQHGGTKADALNAGINVASGTLVLTVDADTVLEPDSLSRAVLPFLEDPATVASGGGVGIANGCRIEGGRVVEIGLSSSWLARFQVVEYMRSFLLFRLACAANNAVVIISGAFGLFRRDAVVAVGGFDQTAIGEDLDLTIRLQRYYRERSLPIRITYDPNPLCWTQAPTDWRSLRNQRYRWRRGLLQSLWRNRRMIGNPRFGRVGLGSLPFMAFFDGLEPLIQIVGYAVMIAALAGGLVEWRFFAMLMAITIFLGLAATLLSVLLSDATSRQYMQGRDLLLLVFVAILESFGFRQVNALWGFIGTFQAMRGKNGWGPMKRRSFR